MTADLLCIMFSPKESKHVGRFVPEKGLAAEREEEDAFRGRTALRGAIHGSAEEGKVRERARSLGVSRSVIVT